jgi:hypothetical protein
VIPVSESSHRPRTESERGGEGAHRRHETTNADLRTGDLARVTCEDTEVDHAAVIARWKFAQQDFSPDTAPEVPVKRWTRTDLTGEEPVEREQVKINGTADRTTLITEDGQVFAVADWTATDDPPYLYLLVIDGEPEERRWMSMGPVQSVERYGAEPRYRLTPLKWGRNRSQDANVLKLAASGEFTSTDLTESLPDGDTLRDLARRRNRSEPCDLTRRELGILTRAYRAARDHVERTGEPVLSSDVDEDRTRLDREFPPGRYHAVFPDGGGGEVLKKSPNSGPPSEDVPPWEQESDADPAFTPLGTGEWDDAR